MYSDKSIKQSFTFLWAPFILYTADGSFLPVGILENHKVLQWCQYGWCAETVWGGRSKKKKHETLNLNVCETFVHCAALHIYNSTDVTLVDFIFMTQRYTFFSESG